MSERTIEIILNSFPKILELGITVTIPLALLSFIIAFIISVLVAFVQYANVKVLKELSRFYIWIVRGTPLLVQLYIAYYGLPSVIPNFAPSAFVTAFVILGLNEGAYMSETMRACLEAVPSGQMEAGRCVGMSYLQVMNRIILPQALRTAIPSLMNSFIALIKDSSLASIITVVDLFRQAQIVNGRVFEPFVLYTEAAVVYLLFCTIFSIIQKQIEKKLNAYGGVK